MVLVSFDTTQLIRGNSFYCFNLRRDGVVVPYGKSLETGVVNPRGYTLHYNGKCTFFLFLRKLVECAACLFVCYQVILEHVKLVTP